MYVKIIKGHSRPTEDLENDINEAIRKYTSMEYGYTKVDIDVQCSLRAGGSIAILKFSGRRCQPDGPYTV